MSYPDSEMRLLDSIHLRVNRGELVFIVGPTDSGKSVLLRLLYKELEPQRGQILVNGRNIVYLRQERLLQVKREVGIIPQGLKGVKYLSDRTVWENVLFKLRILGMPVSEANNQTEEILTFAGLNDQGDVLPADLSALDRERLAIAIAISNDPLLLIYDEPFAGLDSSGANTLLSLLRKINDQGMTIVAATQNIEIAERSGQRVLLLEDGKLVKLNGD